MRMVSPRRVLEILESCLWSWKVCGRARRELRSLGGVRATIPLPPRVPRQAVRGVRWGLRARRATCLERSLVLQRWHLEHGEARDVVIGVKRARHQVLAHAWLEGDPRASEYVEMTRVPAS